MKTSSSICITAIANITGILYALERILAELKYGLQPTQYKYFSLNSHIQRAEVSFSARHQDVNDILALKSISVSSFSDCQKHEDITVKTSQWAEKMKTLVSSFSFYHTWRNDLRLYNLMILAIKIIKFIYLGIVVIWDPWILICHPPVSFVPLPSLRLGHK